jgi:hypothetical protein
MSTSRTDELLTILQNCYNPREEGWLWLATYRDDMDQGVVAQVEGHYEDPPATAKGLATIINEASVDHCYLALCRREGRPAEMDREMWRDLRALAEPGRLIDMVVFNHRESWSMRQEDACAQL